MKKITSIALAAMATIATAAAQQPSETTMNVHITGIRGGEGTIFAVIMAPSDAAAAQASDFQPDFQSEVKSPGSMIPAMIPAREGSVEWEVPVAKVDAGARVYVFHDTNANFRLDRDADGTPLEGCASGTLETVEPNGTAMVELKYFDKR